MDNLRVNKCFVIFNEWLRVLVSYSISKKSNQLKQSTKASKTMISTKMEFWEFKSIDFYLHTFCDRRSIDVLGP